MTLKSENADYMDCRPPTGRPTATSSPRLEKLIAERKVAGER